MALNTQPLVTGGALFRQCAYALLASHQRRINAENHVNGIPAAARPVSAPYVTGQISLWGGTAPKAAMTHNEPVAFKPVTNALRKRFRNGRSLNVAKPVTGFGRYGASACNGHGLEVC